MKKLFFLLFVLLSLNALCQEESDRMVESKFFLRPEIEVIRNYAVYVNFGYQVLPNYSVGAGIGYSNDYIGSIYDIEYWRIMPFTINNRFYLTNNELRFFVDFRIGYIFGLVTGFRDNKERKLFKVGNFYGSLYPGLNYRKWDFGINLIFYEFAPSSNGNLSRFIPRLKVGYNIAL